MDRDAYRLEQTPQTFRASLLRRAYEQPYCEAFTDDASVVEALEHAVHLVEGNREKIKLTTSFDLTVGAQGYEITTATLSANGEEINLKSWYSDKTGENNPNNTGEAVAKFGEGKYMNELYTYVGADGTLTLMVNKPSHVGDNWMLFNNFTLTHYATKTTDVEQLTMDNSQLTIYDLTGRRVMNTENLKGVYVVGGKKMVIK